MRDVIDLAVDGWRVIYTSWGGGWEDGFIPRYLARAAALGCDTSGIADELREAGDGSAYYEEAVRQVIDWCEGKVWQGS